MIITAYKPCTITTNTGTTTYHYIDTEGIAKQVNDKLTFTHDYPFSTLEPDWDVVAQVVDTLKQYGDILKITHVKSHQDDNTPLKELSLAARLNVVAGYLSSNYSIQHGVLCLELPRVAIN
eukprot:4014311-Ditylum_brightwellii.AAC.1